MSSAWGSSWGVAWGNSWGQSSPAPVIGPDTHDGARKKRDLRREDNEHRRGRIEESFAALEDPKPLARPVAVEPRSDSISPEPVRELSRPPLDDDEDDEDAMMVLL